MSFDSIIAIKGFESDNNILDKEGRFFFANVTAFVNRNAVFCGNVDCAFSYNVAFSQYDISIDWLLSESELRKIGLHMGYNTNFQNFNYNDNKLTIIDNKTEIIVSFISCDI